MFVIYSLASFYKNIQQKEYEMQQKMMQNFSARSISAIEDKLTGYMNILSAVEKVLPDGELHSEDTKLALKKIAEQSSVDFERIGIAGTDGNSWLTNDAEINISDSDYFVAAMKKQTMITESKDSKVANIKFFIVSVPILDNEELVQGVLYGVIDTASFHIYDADLDTDSRNIYVIDYNGSYIMKNAMDRSITPGDNFMEWLYEVETDVPAEEIIKKIRRGENIVTEIVNGNETYAAYFASDKMDNWCTITLMNKDAITAPVQRLMRMDVSWMIVRILGAIVLLCIIILYYFQKEKKQMMEMNRQLRFNDEIFNIVTKKSETTILIYDVKTRKLRFINQGHLKINFPLELENAPKTLLTYFQDNHETQKQVEYIFDSLEHLDKNEKFYVAVDIDGMQMNYEIRVTSLLNEKKEVIRCVGVMYDVTETFQLNEKANVDYLTGLYNRRKGTEMINHLLQNGSECHNHAFVIFDLDNFKRLNDTLGHQMGDQALQDVAEILKKHFRNYDIICRLAGDEFVVFLKNIPHSVLSYNLSSLLKKLELAYSNGVEKVVISASAGVALSSLHGTTFEELYEKADTVLYSVKHSGKNSFAIYGETK